MSTIGRLHYLSVRNELKDGGRDRTISVISSLLASISNLTKKKNQAREILGFWRWLWRGLEWSRDDISHADYSNG